MNHVCSIPGFAMLCLNHHQFKKNGPGKNLFGAGKSLKSPWFVCLVSCANSVCELPCEGWLLYRHHDFVSWIDEPISSPQSVTNRSICIRPRRKKSLFPLFSSDSGSVGREMFLYFNSFYLWINSDIYENLNKACHIKYVVAPFKMKIEL